MFSSDSEPNNMDFVEDFREIGERGKSLRIRPWVRRKKMKLVYKL